MLANRPLGIGVNKNAINVQANNVQQSLAGAGLNNVNLKRSLQQELESQPLKGQSSKTPSPPKLKSNNITNKIKQSENDVPALIDFNQQIFDPIEHEKKQQLKQQPPTEPSLKPSQELLRQLEPLQQTQHVNTSTQAVISRIPRLVEVEEEIDDIDKSGCLSRDAIFLVSDVAQDIYSYMYELEEAQKVDQDFLNEQKIFTPKVRQRLVNWCVELTRKLGLMSETMYMSVALIDRYFAKVVVKHQSHVQLVAIGAVLVAAKYEEIYPPDLNDLISCADIAYSRRDVMRMEIDILERLNFDLGRPIPPAFLRRFSRAAQSDHKIHSIAKFLMEISLQEYECAHWKPSLVAAVALFITIHLVPNQNRQALQGRNLTNVRSARMSTATTGLTGTISNSISSFGLSRRLVSAPPSIQDRWNKTLVHYTRYSRRDLQIPAATLCKVLKRVMKLGPQAHSSVKCHLNELSKWPELKSTRVDELIRLGDNMMKTTP